jgi:hypothetical protein
MKRAKTAAAGGEPTLDARLQNQPALVRLSRYCEVTGDTRDAVHARRKSGAWADGIHCHVGPDRRLWVNIGRAQAWVKNGR